MEYKNMIANRLRCVCVGVVVVFLATLPCLAFDQNTGPLAKIPPAMQAFVEKNDISGAVTVVGSKNGVLSLESIGKSNLDKDTAMRKDALFRIASMTKPITAIGIMILSDEGKLSVEDTVEKHL